MSITKLLASALIGSSGLTALVLGCVINGSWWTLFLFLFYGLTPIPLLFVRNDGYDSLDSEVNKSLDIAIFCVTGIVVSTIAYPILITRIPVEQPHIDSTNAFLASMATLLFYTTAGLFFLSTNEEEGF